MLRTEADARESWCPMVRMPSTHLDATPVAAVNTVDGTRRKPTHCIGVTCMMWRWGESHPIPLWHAADNREAIEEPRRAATTSRNWEWEPYDEAEGRSARWTQPQAEANDRRRGYCGLAGSTFFGGVA